MTPAEWADAIYEATGWTVGENLAIAIGGMVEAARRDAAGEIVRLWDERNRLRKALRFMVAAYPLDKFMDSGMRLSAHFEAEMALGDDA